MRKGWRASPPQRYNRDTETLRQTRSDLWQISEKSDSLLNREDGENQTPSEYFLFQFDLETGEEDGPKWGGRTFQSFGAATKKAGSPWPSTLTFRRPRSEDVRVRDKRSLRRSERRGGAGPFRDFKVNNTILKSILKTTGSQWGGAEIYVDQLKQLQYER